MAPQLDVSDAILDPNFAEELCVIRRQYCIQKIGGNAVVCEPQKLNPIGVVTQGSSSNFRQEPDAQNATSIITVHAYQFQFYDPETIKSQNLQFHPDLIEYNGNKYIVTKVLNWSRYGQGFTQVEASLYQYTEEGRQ